MSDFDEERRQVTTAKRESMLKSLNSHSIAAIVFFGIAMAVLIAATLLGY